MNQEHFPRHPRDLVTIALYPFTLIAKAAALVVGTSLALGFWLTVAAIFAIDEGLKRLRLRLSLAH